MIYNPADPKGNYRYQAGQSSKKAKQLWGQPDIMALP